MNFKNFTQLLQYISVLVQGRAAQLVDLSVGSILLSIIEAISAVVIWLQGLIADVLALTRASTSSGQDLDSWFADYGFERGKAASSTGIVNFSRFTASGVANIPVGTTVQTSDGSAVFSVIADSNNPHYDATSNTYILGNGISSINVSVICTTSGTVGNVVIGAVNTITSELRGVDTVTNLIPFTSGLNAETDSSARESFRSYIASLAKATLSAIRFAIIHYDASLSYAIVENKNIDGSQNAGFFYVVIDDGTGAPSSELIANVYQAIDAVRGYTIAFAVYPCLASTVTVSAACEFDSAMSQAEISAAKVLIHDAIVAYINSLKIGETLPYTQIYQVIYNADAGVSNVTGVLVNGGTSDISTNATHVIKAGAVTIS